MPAIKNLSRLQYTKSVRTNYTKHSGRFDILEITIQPLWFIFYKTNNITNNSNTEIYTNPYENDITVGAPKTIDGLVHHITKTLSKKLQTRCKVFM